MIHKCKSLLSPKCNIKYLFIGSSIVASFFFSWWSGALVYLKACPHSFILKRGCSSYFFQVALHVLYQNVTACAERALSDQMSCQSDAHSQHHQIWEVLTKSTGKQDDRNNRTNIKQWAAKWDHSLKKSVLRLCAKQDLV